MTENKETILKSIGYMPSEAMFYPSMKVKEVIKMAADIRKKVSIVCAMQHKPELLFFDEPTSGLDPLMQTEFFKLIEEYVDEGATCLLSTHVLSEVKKYCKNVAIMKEGKVQCVDSVDRITKTNAKRIQLTRDGKQENFLFKGNLNDLIQNLAGHDITELTIEEPSLDEIFMHFYTE